MRTWQPIGARSLLAAAALGAGCTAQLYEGEQRGVGEVAVVNVGSTVVRQIDGQRRRGGAFDVAAFEVTPGPHQLVLVFELPARSLGLKSLPAQPGIGVCELNFEAQGGRQYYLVARPVGDFNSARWHGTWEAWIRDSAIAGDHDVIARCEGAEPTATPTPLIAPAPDGGGESAAPPAGSAAAVAVPAPTPLPLRVGRALRVGAWQLGPQAAAVAPCLESIEGSADKRRPMLGQIPPAGAAW